MERYICIHGHFYQPPRENPWLESIEPQDAAYPYHDWNERVTAECYAPNMASRILNGDGKIVQIVNNYAKISFNFGPTLLAWMESNEADVYRTILDADRESQDNFSGHGSALAQCYNHMIMPLANTRDKHTQIMWGIKDFSYRFQRDPEGMWLPETAVDLESLDILGKFGIKFTILAPHQARRVRAIGENGWKDVTGGKIDPTMPYLINLPSGKTMSIFFYDGPMSKEVAFAGMLSSGEFFARRLLGAFLDDRLRPQIVHIATDGETYGHHRKYGDMALAYAIHYIEANKLAKITNYGEYLEKYPATHEVEIFENTSWSCTHGVERWKGDCGCNSNVRPGWTQSWRKPLRDALDYTRDTMATNYEKKLSVFLKDPWKARNDYIDVVLDRSEKTLSNFISEHAVLPLDETENSQVLKLLELQRHAMLMFTSCGWFFDEISGIETVQIMQYAGRVIQIAGELFEDNVEAGFLDILDEAKSNIRKFHNGRAIYDKFVKPSMLDLTKVGAHYAISSVFEEYPTRARINAYVFERKDYQSFEAGNSKLVIGKVKVTSLITYESTEICFAVLHFGDHNISAGVCPNHNEEEYGMLSKEFIDAFSRIDFTEIIRIMDGYFGRSTFTLRSLFKDEQRKVLDRILESTILDIEAEYRNLYDRYYLLMRFIVDLENPLPQAFKAATRFIFNIDLSRLFSNYPLDVGRIKNLLEDARMWNIELDTTRLSFILKKTLEKAMESLSKNSDRLLAIKDLIETFDFVQTISFEVNLWKVQNIYYYMYLGVYQDFKNKAAKGFKSANKWVELFISLAEKLSIKVE